MKAQLNPPRGQCHRFKKLEHLALKIEYLDKYIQNTDDTDQMDIQGFQLDLHCKSV
jgi:hypothetical protein